MANSEKTQRNREFRPTSPRQERYGGYTPGKNSSELKRPKGLRTPAPSHPRQQAETPATNSPDTDTPSQEANS